MSKIPSVVLILVLVASSLIMIGTIGNTSAQISKPSVPEFTVRYVDSSYYVPPSYGIDEFSGEKVQTGGGFTNYNKTVELSIKPQPFTPYVDGEGHKVDLEYIVEYKGHFGEEWKRYPHNWNIDNFHNTVLFGLGNENSDHSISDPHADLGHLSTGDQVDFRVKAQVGYYTLVPDPYNRPWDVSAVFTSLGESGWSSTQTLTIGENTSTSAPSTTPAQSTPTPTPSEIATSTQTPTANPLQPVTQAGVVFGFDWKELTIASLCIAMAALAVAMVFSAKRKQKRAASEGAA